MYDSGFRNTQAGTGISGPVTCAVPRTPKHSHVSDSSAAQVHAVIPLALLEAVRALDVPAADEPEEVRREARMRRLGATQTVAEQIDRYQAMAARDVLVRVDDLVSLARLCSRRPDVGVVFTNAGRHAARLAARTISMRSRITHGVLPSALRESHGLSLVRRLADRFLSINIERNGESIVARSRVTALLTDAGADGSICEFYSSAIAELLRTFLVFDGAVFHNECVMKDGSQCIWHAEIPVE